MKTSDHLGPWSSKPRAFLTLSTHTVSAGQLMVAWSVPSSQFCWQALEEHGEHGVGPGSKGRAQAGCSWAPISSASETLTSQSLPATPLNPNPSLP